MKKTIVIAVWLQYVKEWLIYEVYPEYNVITKSRRGLNEDLLRFVDVNGDYILTFRKNVKII